MPISLQSISTIGECCLKGTVHAALYPPHAAALTKISLYQGDITKIEVDAIVNAANRSLLGGGGVDAAIHMAAGPQLLAECRKLGGCPTGEAKITRGYRLPAKHVIHTVGPIYDERNADKCSQELASCYRNSLRLAAENSCETLAFPCLSTGIFGYPIPDATRIALDEARKHIEEDNEDKIKRIVFVTFRDIEREAYEAFIPFYFPPLEAS